MKKELKYTFNNDLHNQYEKIVLVQIFNIKKNIFGIINIKID